MINNVFADVLQEGNSTGIKRVEANAQKNDFNQLYLGYYNLFPDMRKIELDLILTQDISVSHRYMRPDLEEELSKDYKSNGMLVLPKRIGEKISILINTNKIDNVSMTWIGTIAHELTHAIDYYSIAEKDNLDNYDPLIRKGHYYAFELWSEYHAKKLGYKFLIEYLAIDKEDSRIKYISETELPYHFEQFLKVISERDYEEILYQAMQFLGRFSIWHNLFPEVFNEKKLNELFRDHAWMYRLYSFLREHETLEDAYPCFSEMLDILVGIMYGE